MNQKLRILLTVVGAFAAGMSPGLAAQLEQWDDGQGKKFRGTPAEVMGPFALFRTEDRAGRPVLLHFLSANDCVRFHRGLPAYADETLPWAKSQGEVSREFPSNVFRLAGDNLERADLRTEPEPKLLMLLCVSGSSDRFRDLMEECAPAYVRLRAKYPELFETIYISARRSAIDHVGLARLTKMPWLIADFDRLSSMPKTMRLAPVQDQWLWVINRDGVPMVSTGAVHTADVTKALGELEALLALLRPGNSRTWPDRVHYYRAVHAAEHSQDRADPRLIGNPVDAAALRQFGLDRLVATMNVAADGSVTEVEISPGENMTAEIAEAAAQALRKAVFAPAVDHGVFVDGVYNLSMDVAPSGATPPPTR